MAPRGRVVDRREQDRTLGAILLVRTDGVAVRAAAPACAAVPPARDTGTGRSAGRVSRKSGQERRYSRRRLALFRASGAGPGRVCFKPSPFGVCASLHHGGIRRSEERRVGQECVSTCSSRTSPVYKNKTHKSRG